MLTQLALTDANSPMGELTLWQEEAHTPGISAQMELAGPPIQTLTWGMNTEHRQLRSLANDPSTPSS